jgi:hypothetical protein
MLTSSSSPTFSDDVLGERHLRKRMAARVRQQRCRARKREAKLPKPRRTVKAPRPAVQQQFVRRPMLICSPPRMAMPLMHHPTSPFIMYPRRYSPPFSSEGLPPHVNGQLSPNLPPNSLGNGAFRSSRPFHNEVMAGSALALGMLTGTGITRPRFVLRPHYPSPNTIIVPMHHHIARVSPVDHTNQGTVMVPMLPAPGMERLGRKEEAAINAMLALHRSSSETEV